MTENKENDLLVERDETGAPRGLGGQVKLILRLLRDGRVSLWLKLIPLAALIYVVSPLDAPIPVIDDAAVAMIGMYAFVELCPPDVVAEHRAAIAAGK